MDFAPVLFALCGLSIVCIGVFVIGGLLLARFTGMQLLTPLLAALVGRDDEEADRIPETPKRGFNPRAQRQTPDLRAKAQSLDFDEAVAKYQKRPVQPRPALGKKPLPPSRFDRQDDDSSSSQSLRRSRGRDRETPEIYDDDYFNDGI